MSMEITVNLYAGLEKYINSGQRKGNRVEVPGESTIKQLLRKLEIPEDQVKIIMVNGRHKQPENKLNSGDTVAIFPPLGGG